MKLSTIQKDRAGGVLLGQAIGDALGVPYEFAPRIPAGEACMVGGGLGRPSSPRRRAYERLKTYAMEQQQTLFSDAELERALDDIYQRPLLETAADLLNRLMRGGVNDTELAEAVKSLREENRLTYAEDDATLREPRVVCSMGLIKPT